MGGAGDRAQLDLWQDPLEVTGDPAEVGLAEFADDDRHRNVEVLERSPRRVAEGDLVRLLGGYGIGMREHALAPVVRHLLPRITTKPAVGKGPAVREIGCSPL